MHVMSEPNTDATTLEELLQRYDAVLQQLDALQDQKNELRQEIQQRLLAAGRAGAEIESDGKVLKATVRTRRVVEYDQALLRERLGERYRLVLAPDMRKIKANLEAVEPLLGPVIEECGSPSQDRVRDAIESGALQREDFRGAFSSEDRSTLYVRRVSPRAAAPSGPEDPDGPY
jgi:hypothetical protein